MWSKENELHEQVNQQLLELNDQAMQRIIAVAMSKCTVKQARICQLLLDGYTQQEIAIIENTNQSSVSKCINGSQVFSKGEYSTKGKTYGGLMRKMSKLLVVDEELRQIIKNMHNIVETL
jgi:DNA-binding CsgD family transcriptional regulator